MYYKEGLERYRILYLVTMQDYIPLLFHIPIPQERGDCDSAVSSGHVAIIGSSRIFVVTSCKYL